MKPSASNAAWKALGDAFRGAQFQATLTLLATPLLFVTWKSFGAPLFYAEWLAPRLSLPGNSASLAGGYCFLSALLLMGLVPALIVKFVFRQPLAAFGVQLGIGRKTLLAVLVGAPVFAIGGWIASLDPAVQAAYPIPGRGVAGTPALFCGHCLTYLGFYIGWEFLFRGFLQFGLRETLGEANAVLVQALASCLAHIGKPTGELIASLPAGIYWGLIAFRTQSLVGCLAQHFVLGVVLDCFLCYR